MRRCDQIHHFYDILQNLEDRLGGKRRLSECHGKMKWPKRGVYFFFEPGEKRSTGPALRVVRVGTHAINSGSRSTLWKRLRTHRGTLTGKRPGGGNHRGSIFRRHVGSAILRKEKLENEYPHWGSRSASARIRSHEHPIEKKVSQHIREMPFLWLRVDDPPGSRSQRAYIERNCIALLSNYGKLGTAATVDSPSPNWLGLSCTNIKIRESGLWNVDHVTVQQCDTEFLSRLEKKIRQV